MYPCTIVRGSGFALVRPGKLNLLKYIDVRQSQAARAAFESLFTSAPAVPIRTVLVSGPARPIQRTS